MRTLVQVPLGKPFLCPECGRPLHTPPAKPRRSSRRTLLVGTGAAAVALLSLGLWRGSDRSSEDHRRIALAAQASLQNAASLQAKAAIQAPPLQTLSTTQSAPAPVTQVDALAEALPTLTLAETAAPAAPATIPSETLAAARYAPSALKVGDEIMAELPTLQLSETLPDPPPLPRDRGFTPVAIAGGAPAYPNDYIHDHRTGEVSLSCRIEQDGQPTGCIVHDLQGGRRFAEAAVNWLNSGAVHFAPILRGGRPVTQQEHWTVSFRPPR